MMTALRGLLLVVCLTVLAPALAAADDGTGCERFAWSVARERGAFAAAEPRTRGSGFGFPTVGSAAPLMLRPAADLVLPVTSEREGKADTFGGFVTIAAPIDPGTYQVTVSDDAWIDVSQDS